MKPLLIEMQAFGPFAGRQVVDFSLLGQKTFFLIHGPTGAGKTSILDAMSFALFGDSSGGEREGHQMRSHHAQAATLTRVRFEFALGDRRYRVVRIPDQDRPARRGAGSTRQLQQAELHRLDMTPDGRVDEVTLASGWRKVSDEVVRLLGFESRQFRQVIMLPQGQFFEFLKSSSQERERILQTLFGTELYRRIAERLSGDAKAVEEQAKVSSTRRQTLLEQAGVPDEPALDARLQTLAEQLEQARQAETQAGIAERTAQQMLVAAQALAGRFGEFDEATAARKALQEQEADKVSLRIRTQRAQAAASVLPYAEAAAKAAGHALEAAGQVQALTTQEQLDAATSAQADSAVDAAREHDPEVESLSRRLLELEALQSKVQALQSARVQREAADAHAKRCAQDHAEADKALQDAAEALRKAASDAQAQQVLAVQQAGFQARVDLLTTQVSKATEVAQVQTEWATALQDEAQMAVALGHAMQAEHAARKARDETHRAWVASQATRLAASLVTDQACPVCGSAHHPAPAHLSDVQGLEFVDDEALGAADEALAQATQGHNAARTHHAEALRQVQTLQTRIGTLQADLPDVSASVDDLGKDLKEARHALEAAQAAAQCLAAAQTRVADATTAQTLAQQRASQTAAQWQAAQTQQALCEGIVREREEGIPPELSSLQSLAGTIDEVSARRALLRKMKEDAATAASSAREALVSVRARVVAAQESLNRWVASLDESVRTRDRHLQSAGFADVQAFEAARMSDAELALAEDELKTFDASRSAAQDRLDRAARDVDGLQRPDVAVLQTAHDEARAAQMAANTAVQQILAAQQTAAKLRTDLLEQATEYQALQARYAVVKRVSDLANGVGGQRMSFQRYVLATLLEEVLAATTRRLQVMSKGRYELRRAATSADRRAAAGLDLEAYDQYTGTVRPVTTLSGGESFLTSLALALGLSDVVQSYAGGIRLDAIFVDEGFGTLDTEALDFAIRALKDLQQAGRMVGIISHVTELREWIDARLEVKSGSAGSVAEFVV